MTVLIKRFIYVCMLSCISMTMHIAPGEVNEFIKPVKKVCPSRNQCCEKKADIIKEVNEVQKEIAKLSQVLVDIQNGINDIQEEAINELTHYVEGNKESTIQSVSKKERIELYENDTNIQNSLESVQRTIALSCKNIEKLSLLNIK